MTHYIGSLLGRNCRSRGGFLIRRLQGCSSSSSRNSSASFSSLSSKLEDPGKLVAGLTLEEVKANPEISEYLHSNFDNEGVNANGEITSGINIPPEVLREFGIEDESYDVDAPEKKYGEPRVDAGLGNTKQQSLNIRVLKTYLRSEQGSRACRRLRDNNILPGILFGSDPTLNILSSNPSSKAFLKTPWPELQRELDRYHRHFESRVYDLTVFENVSDTEGTVHRVVPSSVQWHPVQGSIFCANFVRYHAGRPLKIPFKYINEEESPALKRDGFIIPVKKYVECFVEEGVPIPDALEVECTGLHIKDIIRMDRVIFPDGVKPIDRLDITKFVIGPVRGGRGAATADDSESDDSEA
uniref:Large ribosomal subunit protein bL25 L25 domain-containing protein n=1 Tax=Pseudo-nitzschia australis TaxID=44445 RepID=A0A7S4AB09_9STRA|mmetsp:Transcript_26866/g.58964  ORF Transcript_26866/g.58964 Transcript_26866/m.58964 type:complete len:355 (+) Transcript_26866:106-1170(+)